VNEEMSAKVKAQKTQSETWHGFEWLEAHKESHGKI